jgi:hypothetical protein
MKRVFSRIAQDRLDRSARARRAIAAVVAGDAVPGRSGAVLLQKTCGKCSRPFNTTNVAQRDCTVCAPLSEAA